MSNSSSQRMQLVSVAGISGYWQTKSGGVTSAETTKNWNGGSLTPEVLSAPAETDNIAVSRAFNYDRDYNAQKAAVQKVGRWRTTVTVTHTDEDLKSKPGKAVYANALLVRCSEPDYDSSSSDVSMWELEFAVERRA